MVGEVCRWGGACAHAGWIGIIRVEPVEKHPYCLIVVFGGVWQWVFSLRRMRRADLVLSLDTEKQYDSQYGLF